MRRGSAIPSQPAFYDVKLESLTYMRVAKSPGI